MIRALFVNRLSILLTAPLLISLACSTLSGGSPSGSQPQELVIEEDVVYGPGSFNLPDTRLGLVDLSSYKATLTIVFDGTRAGTAEKWSKTYLMLTTTEPAARQLTIEKTGDFADANSVFMFEMDGVDDERHGDGVCTSSTIESGNSIGERFEPAGFLNFVIGAEEAGSETVNKVAANHYTFDQRAMGEEGLTEATGELWVAAEGGYIVKYVLTRKAKADYFGEGIEGVLTLDYELTDVNKPVEIKLPEDCPLGMVDAPQLPDASNVVKSAGILTYDTPTSLAEAVAFYQKQLPDLGWKPVGEPTVTDINALLVFTRGAETMSVVIATDKIITKVQILLSRS